VSVELNFMLGDWDEAMRAANAWLAESDAGSTHALEPAQYARARSCSRPPA